MTEVSEIEKLIRLPARYERVEYPVGMAQLRWRLGVLEQQWVITVYDGHEKSQITEWREVPAVNDL